MAQVYWERGGSFNWPQYSAPLLWKNNGPIQGVVAYARDEARGVYVQIFETAPDEAGWVDGGHESFWTRGNFETVEAAKRAAGAAYRKINQESRRAA